MHKIHLLKEARPIDKCHSFGASDLCIALQKGGVSCPTCRQLAPIKDITMVGPEPEPDSARGAGAEGWLDLEEANTVVLGSYSTKVCALISRIHRKTQTLLTGRQLLLQPCSLATQSLMTDTACSSMPSHSNSLWNFDFRRLTTQVWRAGQISWNVSTIQVGKPPTLRI